MLPWDYLMRWLRRKPRCPACQGTDHLDPAIHADRAIDLELEAITLAEAAKEAMRTDNEAETRRLEDLLLEVRDRLSTETMYAKRAPS